MPTTIPIQGESGARRRLAIGFVLVLLSHSARAGPSISWTLSLHGGYDDQVYADPERLGIVQPVAEFLGTTRTRFLLHDDQLGRNDDRLEFSTEGSWTTYGDNVSGVDHGLTASASYYRWFSASAILETSLSALRFRRGDLPLFDLNQIEVGARLSSISNGPWLLGAKAVHRWPSFPGRILAEGADRTEEDRQMDLSGSVLREIGGSGFLSIEVGGRWNRSNDPLVKYRGPLVTGRWGIRRAERLMLAAYASFARRSYEAYPVLEPREESFIDTGDRRNDSTWGFGIAIERCLARSVKAFADLGRTHQRSNIADLAFDQTRVSVGLQFVALSRESDRRAAFPSMRDWVPRNPDDRTESLAPRRVDGGILFRHRNLDAKRVSVVGGFNGWDSDRNPLSGPGVAGIWETTVRVPAGMWRFAFVVDGEWTRPYDAMCYEDDGFGGENGILRVDEDEVP